MIDERSKPVPGIPIVLVGHCGADRWSLSRLIRHASEDSIIEAANDDAGLESLLDRRPSLLLVNRALDGDFAARDGIELIGDFMRRHPGSRAMLISNFPDAQQQALAAGALPGFGKSDLQSGEARRLLREGVAVVKATST